MFDHIRIQLNLSMNVVLKNSKKSQKSNYYRGARKKWVLSDKVKSFCHEQKIGTEIFSFTLKDEFYHFYVAKDLLSKHGLDVNSIL